MLLVVAQDLPLAWRWPILAGRNSLWELSLYIAQILDAVARQRDLFAGRRDSSHQVISFPHNRFAFGDERSVLPSEIPVLHRNRICGTKAALRGYGGSGARLRCASSRTRVEIGARRILAMNPSLCILLRADSAAAGALQFAAAAEQALHEIKQAHDSFQSAQALRGTVEKTNLRFSDRLFHHAHLQAAALSHGPG